MCGVGAPIRTVSRRKRSLLPSAFSAPALSDILQRVEAELQGRKLHQTQVGCLVTSFPYAMLEVWVLTTRGKRKALLVSVIMISLLLLALLYSGFQLSVVKPKPK